MTQTPMSLDDLTTAIVNAMLERRGVAIRILNLEETTAYTNRFIICSGHAARQVRAIADNVLMRLKHSHSVLPSGVEGRGVDQWIVLDYRDVVVHVFQPEQRSNYDLDGLWAEAELISLESLDVEASPESLLSPGQPIFEEDLDDTEARNDWTQEAGVAHVSWSDWDEFAPAGGESGDWLFQPEHAGETEVVEKDSEESCSESSSESSSDQD